jgi:hypothetical protein
MTKLEELEQSLSDLAAKEARLLQMLQATTATPLSPEESFEVVEGEERAEKQAKVGEKVSPYECKQLLLVLKDLKLLPRCLQWLQGHGPACYTSNSHLTVAFPWPESIRQRRQDTCNQPELQEILALVPNESFCLFGFDPVQMTRGCVALCQHPLPETQRVADVLAVAGCCALNRRDFEAPDYTPLLEEILLKEAIQPVILMK